MATPIPKSIKDLCSPAALYFIVSFFALLSMMFQNYGNTDTYCLGEYECSVSSTIFIFVLKSIYILFWTWVLDLICKSGYTKMSWFLILFPIVLLSLLIGLMFIM